MSFASSGWGAAAGAAAGLVERDWNKRDTVVDQDFEREMVGRQEEFQTSSAMEQHQRNLGYATTAHDRNLAAHGSRYQRTMADMKKAGLNPMLAYKQGGGSMPGASSPSAASPSGSKGSARGTKQTSLGITAGLGAGAQVMQAKTQFEVSRANIRLLDSSAELNSAKALQVARQTTKTEAETVGQITENEIRALKKLQRETTGDSALGRWITTVFRTGKMGYREFRKLMAATHKMGRRHRAQALKFLDKYGFHVERRKPKSGRFDYGKATNKKTLRRKHTRRDGGPR